MKPTITPLQAWAAVILFGLMFWGAVVYGLEALVK